MEMRGKLLAVAALVAVGLAGAALLIVGEERERPPADFEITLVLTGAGIEAVCNEGCAWTEVTFHCGARVPCAARLDQFGIESTPR